MDTDIRETYIQIAEYFGPDRRQSDERRVALDPRRVARFDKNGGDRRSGFDRRITE